MASRTVDSTHTLVVHPGHDEVLDPECLEDGVQVGFIEAAKAVLGDDDVPGCEAQARPESRCSRCRGSALGSRGRPARRARRGCASWPVPCGWMPLLVRRWRARPAGHGDAARCKRPTGSRRSVPAQAGGTGARSSSIAGQTRCHTGGVWRPGAGLRSVVMHPGYRSATTMRCTKPRSAQ